jgi:hypothetical protein
MKFPTLSTTARSFSAAQPPSSSEFTAEKARKKKQQKGKSKERKREFRLRNLAGKREPNQHHKFIRSLTFRNSSDPSKARVTANWGQFFFGTGQSLFLLPPHRHSGEQQAQIPPDRCS